jgi:hypothetical protein
MRRIFVGHTTDATSLVDPLHREEGYVINDSFMQRRLWKQLQTALGMELFKSSEKPSQIQMLQQLRWNPYAMAPSSRRLHLGRIYWSLVRNLLRYMIIPQSCDVDYGRCLQLSIFCLCKHSLCDMGEVVSGIAIRDWKHRWHFVRERGEENLEVGTPPNNNHWIWSTSTYQSFSSSLVYIAFGQSRQLPQVSERKWAQTAGAAHDLHT